MFKAKLKEGRSDVMHDGDGALIVDLTSVPSKGDKIRVGDFQWSVKEVIWISGQKVNEIQVVSDENDYG